MFTIGYAENENSQTRFLFSSVIYFFCRQMDWSAYTKDLCNLFIGKRNAVFHLIQKSDKPSIWKSYE